MLNLFRSSKPDHPLAELKEARNILEAVPANDSFKALDELAHWHESVRAVEGFKPEYRAQLVQLIDETAQIHLRRLSREYLSSPRLPKFQENRLWVAIHEYWRQSALAMVFCIEPYASGAKGTDALKSAAPLLSVRALRALAAQMKWQYLRYGPFDNSLWAMVAKIYALAEQKNFARIRLAVYPNVPGESSPEQEFLRAVVLAASSPDGLTPVEIEIAERSIAHFSASFTLVLEQQPDIAYWIDLAAGEPPLRLARPPQHAPTLRFFAAGKAGEQLEALMQAIRSSNAIPSSLNLGGTYEPQVVLAVLQHLAMVWSPKPPERKFARHTVKSRLVVTHGFDGVLAALDSASSLDFDQSRIENWVVENVSAGGFGALVPQVKGDWLKIGALIGLQPEGGENWLIGVIRRFNRDSSQRGAVGVQTFAKSAEVVPLRIEGGHDEAQTGILLHPLAGGSDAEAQLLLPAGVVLPGQNLEMQAEGRLFLLLPAGAAEHGDDYELLRFRKMMRDSAE
ncbi:MAG: hypothetical protein HY661_08265 [Betaproteobacteria bacterium]|nr:hypothetical protein [Betaproteobacteria bacterium]